MEGSNGRVKGIPKQSRGNRRSQLYQLRCADLESLMEYEDTIESDTRYVDSEPTPKPSPRGRAQSRFVGKPSWIDED